MMAVSTLRLLVLGTGSCAHALAGVTSSHRHVDVRVLTPSIGEAELWNSRTAEFGFDVAMKNWELRKEKHFITKPNIVSHNPSQVAPGCQMFIFTGSLSDHDWYFQAIRPFLEPGCVLVGMPGGCGFSFQAKAILTDQLKQCLLVNFNACPWVCHINTFGCTVTVTSTKKMAMVSTLGGGTYAPRITGLVKMLEQLLYGRPLLAEKGHILGDSLTDVDAILNPCVMYGQWCDWDGQAMDSAPLFYQGINEVAAGLATGIGDEAVSVAKAICQQKPGIDLSRVIHLKDLYKITHDIDEPNDTDVLSLVANDWDRAGLRHKVKQLESGQLVPDFRCRQLTVDVPLGLVVMRGIATIVGVQTPYMDEVIRWSEEKMGKEYIVFDKPLGRDINETRCPQKYGFKTLDEILHN